MTDPYHSVSWLRVREGNPQAASLLAVMHDRIFSPAYERIWQADDFTEVMRMPGAEVLLLKVQDGSEGEGVPAGFLALSHMAGEAEILTFGIDPEFQGRGLGRQALCQYLASAKGISDIFLEVRQSNHAAIGLYKHVGFTQTGLRPDYYKLTNGQRENAILMHYQVLDQA